MLGEYRSTVEYIEPSTIKYYSECEPLVKGLGYSLVELQVFRRHNDWQVKAVITGGNGVGVDDCAKIHRALLTRLEAILDSQDIYVEVASPGLDRIVKNAAEFKLFIGKTAKFRFTDANDWIHGSIVSSDDTAVHIDTGTEKLSVPHSKIAKAKLA